MGDLSQITWGIDGIGKSVLERRLPKPIDRMDASEVAATLKEYDSELSYLEEETDFKGFNEFGGRKNPRSAKATQAEERKEKINQPDGDYQKLISRSLEVAESPLERRAVDLRRRRALYDALENQPEFIRLRDATRATYGQKRLKIDGVGEVSIGRAQMLMQKETNPSIREALYHALRTELADVEVAFFDEIKTLNGLVAKISPTMGHNFTNFFEVSANYCEAPSPEHIGKMMRRFVEETKDIYNALIRELVSAEHINPWDFGFIMNQRDPFTKLPVPQDPTELFNAGLALLKDFGYPQTLVDELYDSKSPGVFLDIEKRDGKIPGAATFSLGPLSIGKNMLYYEPVVFSGNPRKRWGVFPHEFGHGLHFNYSRLAAKESGAIFFIESTPGSETISETHENAAFHPAALEKYLGVSQNDFDLFAKWKLFNDIAQMYGMARVALGELAIHTQGVEHARTGNLEAEILTRPDIIKGTPRESTMYLTTPHIHGQPGYYFAYFVAANYEGALSHSIRAKNGTLLSPATAQTLTRDIMVGNTTPMAERIAKATGEKDFIGSVIKDCKERYKAS
jgi:hypothetical protein